MCEDLAVAQSVQQPERVKSHLIDDPVTRLPDSARFMIVRTSYGIKNGAVREVVGQWLTISEANRVADLMNERWDEANPWRRWGDDRWGIERHSFTAFIGGQPRVGDIIIHKVIEASPARFELAENTVVTEYEAFCRLTELDAVGRPAAGIDPYGERVIIHDKKFKFTSQDEVSVEVAFSAMQSRLSKMDTNYPKAAFYRGCFRFLTDALRIGTPTYPEPIPEPMDRLDKPFTPALRWAALAVDEGGGRTFRDITPLKAVLELKGIAPLKVQITEMLSEQPGCFFVVKRVDGAALFCRSTASEVAEEYGLTELAAEVAKGHSRLVPVRVEIADKSDSYGVNT